MIDPARAVDQDAAQIITRGAVFGLLNVLIEQRHGAGQVAVLEGQQSQMIIETGGVAAQSLHLFEKIPRAFEIAFGFRRHGVIDQLSDPGTLRSCFVRLDFCHRSHGHGGGFRCRPATQGETTDDKREQHHRRHQ